MSNTCVVDGVEYVKTPVKRIDSCEGCVAQDCDDPHAMTDLCMALPAETCTGFIWIKKEDE